MSRNLVLFFVSVLILAYTISYHVNFLNYKSPIPYEDWEKITWSDFRGRNYPNFTLYGGKKFAFISTQIKVSQTPIGDIEIVTYFHPARSYVFNKSIVNQSLLQHELYHFHLAESVARMMRKKVSSEPLIGFLDLSDYLSSLQEKEDSLQQAYDNQTYHGYLNQEQKRWERYIDSTLVSMIDYTNHVVKK